MRAPGDVGVGVERDTDIGVPELFLNDGLREGGALPPLLDFGRSWSSPLGTRGASPTAVTESGLGVRFWRPSLVPRPQHRSCRRSHLQFLIATGAALLYLALHAQRGYGYDRLLRHRNVSRAGTEGRAGRARPRPPLQVCR